MTTINVKEARERFRRLLEKAEHGEEVIITRRGRPVARLSRLASRPAALPGLADFRKSLKITGPPLSRAVVQNRTGERW